MPIIVHVCQSKVFDDIIIDQLMHFMNDKLCDLLSPYINYYSTQHVLLHAIEEWKVADNGQPVGMVLMDIRKAFNSILRRFISNN